MLLQQQQDEAPPQCHSPKVLVSFVFIILLIFPIEATEKHYQSGSYFTESPSPTGTYLSARVLICNGCHQTRCRPSQTALITMLTASPLLNIWISDIKQAYSRWTRLNHYQFKWSESWIVYKSDDSCELSRSPSLPIDIEPIVKNQWSHTRRYCMHIDSAQPRTHQSPIYSTLY